MFSFIKEIKASKNVIDTYEKRLIACENAINRLNSEVLSVASDNNTLRNKVLRKIQFKRDEEEEKTQDLNTTSPFSF